jgi:hypothetical protein
MAKDMSEKTLSKESIRQEMATAVDGCLGIIAAQAGSPQDIAMIVGNVVANVAGIFARNHGVEVGAEIHAAINCISSKSVDMYLKESSLDVDTYHDFYMRCLITIAGSLREGVLIKSNKGEKENE